MPYLGRSTDGFGVRDRFVFTASGSETSLRGSDDNSRTPSFVHGYGSDDTNHSFNMMSYHYTFLDSPNTTSQQTYAVRVKVNGGTLFLNRAENNENAGSRPQGVSSIILMEIGA